MSDLNELLTEYHRLVLQVRELEEKKKSLRQEITTRIQGREFAAVQTGDHEVRATLATSTFVQYDEEGLRQRLGNRFRFILDPDPKKIQQHLPELRPVLEPFLDTIGTVSRERVKQAIEMNLLSSDDFTGLFEKETRTRLTIRLVPTR
jgi:hypothetical protein